MDIKKFCGTIANLVATAILAIGVIAMAVYAFVEAIGFIVLIFNIVF